MTKNGFATCITFVLYNRTLLLQKTISLAEMGVQAPKPPCKPVIWPQFRKEQAPEGLLITKSLVKSDDTEDVEHSDDDDRSEKCNANGFYDGVYMPE